MKTLWLDWKTYPVKIGFSPDKKSFEKIMKEIGSENSSYPKQIASTTTFTNENNNCYILVTLNELLDEENPIEVMLSIIHESVHVWQRVKENIGQSGICGDEIDAYSIEFISKFLIVSYKKTRM